MAVEDAFIGYPINFNDICLVYPPFNKNIIRVGYDRFNLFTSLIIKSREEIEDELSDTKEIKEIIEPFTYLVLMSGLSQEVEKVVKEGFSFYTHEKITILLETQQIIIGEIKEKRIIDKDNFFDFQNAVRAAIGSKEIEKPKENEDPRVRRFKALQRKRDKVKAKQTKNNTKEFITLLTSTCCLGQGINPMNIGDITFAAMNLMIERYAMKDAYDTSIAVTLVGGENKDNSYWIKDIDN